MSIIFTKNSESFHHILSFTCRQRRLTKRQQYVLDHYWSTIGVVFNHSMINFVTLFGRNAPIILEIGFGMGTSLMKMVKKFPEKNFLGIEVYLPGVSACLASAYENKIKNLRIICHDAVEVLYKMIPDNSLSIVQLFFPDPWQKRRHNKRRIIQISFVKLIKSKLMVGGIFHIATDWEPYVKHILNVISLFEDYKNQSRNDFYIQNYMLRSSTKFEQRGYRLGHKIWDLIFERIK